MHRFTRRAFLLSSASFSVGCALHRAGIAPAPASVRAPSVGQSWRYAKVGTYSGRVVENQVDQIAAVDGTVHIDSHSEAATGPKKSWARRLLSSYAVHENPLGPLPGEIQEPWGQVLVDPHWSEVQLYETAIPLWPTELEPGWSSRFFTKYTTPTNDVPVAWDQTMTAHAWESVHVPAGRFTALRFTNLIDFADGEGLRTACQRKETLWFAPEVGRWVIRESGGTYYLTNSSDDSQHTESSYRWELLDYT
jgi:hypothetical protein